MVQSIEKMKPSDSFMTVQHDVMKRIIENVDLLCQNKSYLQAAKRFGELRHLLEMHILTEERVLLPLLKHHTGDPEGYCSLFTSEHQRILRLIEKTAQAISQWNYGELAHGVKELRSLLSEHHAHEEHILHSALDGLVCCQGDWDAMCTRALAQVHDSQTSLASTKATHR
jgi:hypothetical protein